MLQECLTSLSLQSVRPRVVVVAKTNLRAVEGVARDHGASVVRQTSTGIAAAINEGWESDGWRSDFTGWLGDDDVLTPQSIELASLKLLRNRRASMAHGRCLIVDRDGNRLAVVRNGWIGSAMAGWGVNLIAQPGCLFRTALVRQVGGVSPALRYAMDIDLYLKLRRYGRIVSVPHTMAKFRAHDGGLSTAESAAARLEADAVMASYRSLPWVINRPLNALARKVSLAVFELTKRMPA